MNAAMCLGVAAETNRCADDGYILSQYLKEI